MRRHLTPGGEGGSKGNIKAFSLMLGGITAKGTALEREVLAKRGPWAELSASCRAGNLMLH